MSRQPAAVAAEFTTAQADVTDEDAVRAAFAACRKVNGPIEILVNNSGIADSAPLVRTSLALFERIVATNLTGTFLCSREAAQDMLIAQVGTHPQRREHRRALWCAVYLCVLCEQTRRRRIYTRDRS